MSMKGFLTNFWQKAIKVGDPLLATIKDKQQYVSISQHANGIYGQRTTPKGLGAVSTGNLLDAADPANILSLNALPITGHALKVGDTIRFTTGLASSEEATVIDASDPNWVAIVGLNTLPALGDAYTHLTPITASTDLAGNPVFSQATRTVVDTLDNLLETPSGVRAIPDNATAGLEIVASTANEVFEIQFIHDMGEPCDLYIGAGAGTFLCHLPLTPDEKVTINIPLGSRLTIRHSKATGIDDASSFYQMNLIG